MKEENKKSGIADGLPGIGGLMGKKEEEKKEDKPEVGQMKKGDYMIHVFIEQAKQLKVLEGATLDPIIEVSLMNEKKFTTAKDDIGSTGVVNWMEHIFFEPKGLKVEEIEQAKISIKLLDKGYFKDAMVGIYEFDVAFVYFKEQHTMFHQWVALSNPSSPNFNEVTGYLKLSISVAATGDEQIQINEDTSSNDDEAIMMPPSIKPEFYQIRFRFFKAEKLPIMDTAILGKGGSIDAYVICKYMNQSLKTKVYTMKNDIVIWNQEFLIPCQLPIMSSRLVMKLYDEDKLQDEIVGSMIFNLKEVIGDINGTYFWKNVYGSPLDVSGENTTLMNANPDLASTWKGRILMQVTAEKVEKPEIGVVDLTEPIVETSLPYTRPHEYEIMAEIGVGIALPAAHKYNVKIKIADFEIKTEKAVAAENTFNRWNYRTPKLTMTTTYQHVNDMGKVFIYLMDGEKPVCYAKQDITNFTDPNPTIQWVELDPDLSIGKVKEQYQAGMISFKLAIHDKTLNGSIDFAQFGAWKKPPPKRPQIQKVRAYIFQCRDLPAADSSGSSDPYIQVWDTGKTVQKTKYITDNVNPLFYETLELMYEANSLEEMPPFLFDIFDKDFGPLDGDDFICRAVIPFSECHYTKEDKVPKPKWHPCRLKKGAPDCGEVLVSFSIVADDFNFKTPLAYMDITETVHFDEYVIEINILGLRDLQSVGYLPVKKAFIQFSLKSLVPPNCSQAIENIKTQPGPAGPNPTINTLIKFTLPLPGDPLYCPKLQCTVYDNIFKSFLQPLLGVFTIPIGDLLFDMQRTKQEEISNLDHIISELSKIIDDIGVTYYTNIQSVPLEVEDLDFRRSQQEVKDIFRRSMSGLSGASSGSKKIAPEDVKKLESKMKPLLDNLDDDENEQEMGMLGIKGSKTVSVTSRTPRKTPRDMMGNTPLGGVSAKKKGGAKLPVVKFDKFLNGNKTQLLTEKKEEDEKIKRELESQRERELEDFKRTSTSSFKTLIMPQYKLDERLNVYREIDPPPDSLYIGLGFDDVPEDHRRHYRRYYTEELEKVKAIMPNESPFDQFIIKRGQSRGASKGWWPFSGKKEDDSGATTTELIAGKFKGLISIESERERDLHIEQKEERLHSLKTKLNTISLKKLGKPAEFKLEKLDTMEGRLKFRGQMESLGVAHLEITKHLSNMQTEETLKRMLLAKTKCLVRVYIISAYDLSSRDNGSPSDPYCYITLGNKNYNERDNYILDEPNPEFYKSYDFEADFPGCPPLQIQLFDYDDLFGDDLIGETKIDLEDRFFSPEWQSCKYKPIEYRQLFHESSSIGQGTLKCWVDIFPTTLDPEDMEQFDIRPKEPQKFEVRVVIYDTIDIKMMDAEGTSDVFIRTFFDSKEQTKETDTHFRCSDGKASFNYRLLFNIKHPRKDCNLTIQAYDRDFFKSNDIIGESRINLKLAIEDAALAARPVSLNKKYYEQYLKNEGIKMDFKDDDSFWVQLVTRDDKNQIEKTGRIRVRIDIYPEAQAEMNKVGEARSEPNISPFLPPPFGRISFTINPLKMFEQLVPPAMRRKIYLGCCIALCCVMCIAMFPMIFSNVITQILTGWM